MIVINFTHPLTEAQNGQIEGLSGRTISRVIPIKCELAQERPFAPQIRDLVAQCDLSQEQWQTEPILINPPGLAPATAVLLAELHGRMGYFPPLIRIRPTPTVPPVYELVEIVPLQEVRAEARRTR